MSAPRSLRAALGSAGVDADLGEVEEPVEQPHVPVRRAARSDVAEDTGVAAREVTRTERRECPRPHRRERGSVDDRDGRAGARVEQTEQPELGGQPELMVADVVPDHLHAGELQRLKIAPEDVEVSADGGVRAEVHPRLDRRQPRSLRAQSLLDCREDLLVGQRDRVHVGGAEEDKVVGHRPSRAQEA